jgi:glycosyltransferase involved in cell wall biosynthesis
MPTGGDLHGRRITIVSIYYAPEETGIAPYATAVAEHYAAAGAEVTALVGMPHYPEWDVHPEYRGRLRLRERRNNVDVRRFRTFVPRTQRAATRATYEATFLLHAATAAHVRADLVLAVIPNLSGGVLGAALAALHRCPFGVIVQDLTGPAAAQSGMPGGGRVAGVTKALEAWVVRRAEEVAVVSDGFRAYLTEEGVDPERITTLRNWSRMPSATRSPHEVRQELGWAPDQTIVLHAGNMGLKQGLEHVVAAARTARESHPTVRFVLMGDGNQRRELEQAAEHLSNVSFLPPAYGTDYADTVAAADVLLVNERSSVLDMSLPSKLTSYFTSGRPVVAAVAENGVTAREIEHSGGGVVAKAENPAALLAAVAAVAADDQKAAALAEAGRRYAQEQLSEQAALARAEALARRLLDRPGRD